MKIGIDCRTILNPGFGEDAELGHYTYCLVEALVKNDSSNRYVLFFDRLVSEEGVKAFLGEHHPRVEYRFLPFHEYRKYLPGVWEHAILPATYAKERLDILFVPSGSIPATYPGKTVVTAPDLPHVEETSMGTFKRANRVIAFSENSKRALMSRNKIAADKIDVIYEGVTPKSVVSLRDGTESVSSDMALDALRLRFGLSEKFVLMIGTVSPQMNIAGALHAFVNHLERHPADASRLQFVLAGAKGPEHDQIFSRIDELNDELESKFQVRPIKYVGYVTIDEKWALLRHAECFVYPSLRAGMGLPVLEAMSVGTPVIVSNRGALPELVGQAGLVADPDFTNELGLSLTKILSDRNLRDLFGEKARSRAQDFTWEKAAKETLNTFHRAMIK